MIRRSVLQQQRVDHTMIAMICRSVDLAGCVATAVRCVRAINFSQFSLSLLIPRLLDSLGSLGTQKQFHFHIKDTTRRRRTRTRLRRNTRNATKNVAEKTKAKTRENEREREGVEGGGERDRVTETAEQQTIKQQKQPSATHDLKLLDSVGICVSATLILSDINNCIFFLSLHFSLVCWPMRLMLLITYREHGATATAGLSRVGAGGDPKRSYNRNRNRNRDNCLFHST